MNGIVKEPMGILVLDLAPIQDMECVVGSSHRIHPLVERLFNAPTQPGDSDQDHTTLSAQGVDFIVQVLDRIRILPVLVPSSTIQYCGGVVATTCWIVGSCLAIVIPTVASIT